MVQLVVPLVGALIGNAAITGTILGLTGAQLGFLAGSVIGAAIFKPDIPDIGAGGGRFTGPRLADRQVQSSSYGVAIPRGYGAFRIAGNIIWAEDLIETEVEQDAGGGQVYTEYLYSANFAISICEGPIVAVTKIWADGKLIFNTSTDNTGPQVDPEVYPEEGDSLNTFAANGPGMQAGVSVAGLAIYLGGEDQEPDPTIVEVMGDSPAYRGQAYIVFTGMRLKKFGNRIPNLSFEVVTASSTVVEEATPYIVGQYTDTDPTLFTTFQPAIDPQTNYIWIPDGKGNIVVMDLASGQIVKTIEYGAPPGDPVSSTYYLKLVTYNPVTRTMWCSQRLGGLNNKLVVFNCDTYEEVALVSAQGTTQINVYDPGGRVMTGITDYPGDFLRWYDASSTTLPFRSGFINFAELLPSAVSDVCYQTVPGGGQLMLVVADIGGNDSYIIYDAATRTPKQWETGITNRSSSNIIAQFACYDSKRDRFLILGSATVGSQSYANVYDTKAQAYITFDLAPTVGVTPSFTHIFYHAPSDSFLVRATNLVTGFNNLIMYRAEDGAFIKLIQETPSATATNFMVSSPSYSDRVFSLGTGGKVYAWPITSRYTAGSLSLADVVTAECARADIGSADIDVTLLNDTVLGYYISNQGSIRSSLEQLMMAYQFDAVESQGKVKFVPRGGAVSATITLDELAAHEFGKEVPTPLPLNRADENDLPAVMTVNYSNKSADYQISTQSSKRLTSNSILEAAVSLPFVLTDSRAKAIADSALYSAWVARTTTSFSTTTAYSELEPTDLVDIEGNTIRIIEKKLEGNIITFTGVFESNTVYLQGSIAGEPLPSEQGQILLAAKGRLILLDIPLYRDSDEITNLSFYSAATPYTQSNWRGIDAYRSTDGGSTYIKYNSYPTQAVAGFAKNVLEPYNDNLVDEYNVLRVVMTSGTLSSITYEELINGGNLCILGNEILQFRTATLVDANIYDLTGLLRGRRGSSTANHRNGDLFIVPGNTTVTRPFWTVAEINQEYFYKGVAPGQSINDAPYVRFTNTGSGAKPLSPVQFAAGRNASNDITFTWVRRTRINGTWQPDYDVSLGEDTEAYEVVIYDDNTYTTEVRTISVTAQTASYTAAQQTTDFGSAQSTVYARVYQLSATVGRGFPAQGAL